MGKIGGLASIAAAAVVAVAVAGCGNPQPGRPVAAAAVTTTDEPTTTGRTVTTTTTTSVSRPKPLDMRAVDPCALLRDMRPADFGIDMKDAGIGGESSIFPGSKDCFTFGHEAHTGLGLTAAVNQGFDSYVGAVRATIARSDLAGYRFAQVRPANPESCFAVVDVNDGQLLYLSTISGAIDPVTPQDTLCGLLPTAAGAALRVLAG
jgi:hypothetical protein